MSLVRLIDVGGMSAVYEAVHRNGRRAAVKILQDDTVPPELLQRHAAYESFVANSVGHPGVVRILDDDVAEDGSVYIVMELLEGETLEERMRREGGALPVEHALPIFKALLDILGAAHERGIVHRDIKPGNVFITHDGTVKVLDFGLARAGAETRVSGSWFGTPGFLAPEQARGAWNQLDPRTDVWAVAATMFAALTGRVVHEGKTPRELVVAAATRPVQPMASAELGIPKALAAVLDRALSYDRNRRWPHARAMRDALQVVEAMRPRSPRPMRVVRSFPSCRSMTRVYRLDAATCGGKTACTLCPVCTADVPVRRPA